MSRYIRMRYLLLVLGLATLAGIWIGDFAGSLEPPGTPAPTMKTLGEVEPRIAIHAVDLPFVISSPGSYYLAENITTTGYGIGIYSDDVTLDLMGFTLSCGSTAISGSPGIRNVTIRNGTVSGGGSTGIEVNSAQNGLFEDLRLEGNAGEGLSVGYGSTIRNCVALDNTGRGILSGGWGTIDHCIARGNQGMAGIQVGQHSIVSDSIAENNTGHGIYANSSSMIVNSVFRGNGGDGIGQFNVDTAGLDVTGSLSESNAGVGINVGKLSLVIDNNVKFNDGVGIAAGSNSIVRGNLSSRNDGDGILVYRATIVENNHCTQNGISTPVSAGVHVTGPYNRIEANNFSGNDYGLLVEFDDNLIIRNTATDNTTHYDISGTNTVGTIVTTEVAMNGATNDLANIEY